MSTLTTLALIVATALGATDGIGSVVGDPPPVRSFTQGRSTVSRDTTATSPTGHGDLVELAFTGGSAMDYIDLVRSAGAALDFTTNIVAKPGLADVTLPAMTLTVPSEVATEAALAAIGGLQFPVGERTVAEIRLHDAGFGIVQAWADFVTTTVDGRIVRTLRMPTEAELAAPRLPESSWRLGAHAIPTERADETLDLIRTALELAGVSRGCRLQHHAPTGTLLVFADPAAHQVVETVLAAGPTPPK